MITHFSGNNSIPLSVIGTNDVPTNCIHLSAAEAACVLIKNADKFGAYIAAVTPNATPTEIADVLRDFAMFDGDMSIDNTMIDHDENAPVGGLHSGISLSYDDGSVVRYSINPDKMGEFYCETRIGVAEYTQLEVDAGRSILDATPYFESKFIPSPPDNFCGDAIVDTTTPYACDDGDGCSRICEIEDPQTPYLIGLDTDFDGQADILDADLDGDLDVIIDISCNAPVNYAFDLIADVPSNNFNGGSMPQNMGLYESTGRITYDAPCSDAGQSFVVAFNADNGPTLAINYRIH